MCLGPLGDSFRGGGVCVGDTQGGGVPSLCPCATVIGSSTSLPATFSFTHNGREDFLHVKTRQYASTPHNKPTESTRKLDNRTAFIVRFLGDVMHARPIVQIRCTLACPV